MKKKIVIIGALGYLGTELCKLYSGESWFHNIIAIDSRFISKRVNELKNWNIRFYQGEILDKSFLHTHLSDADIVFHLAGITDVAYVKKETNKIQDEKIKIVAIDGTNNILNLIPEKCKIIFPSTHVIYEGLKETKKNIKENEKPCPILMYSSSKVANEQDIRNSKKDHVILRLGSVHGYASTDTMRINIMPNLFSKIASQNGVINLFAGGKQIKSVVSLIDVVRCMKFMAENKKIKNETFNLVQETVTVKEVAEICKKYNPKVKIKTTQNEIPNFGYSLSNKKILNTGFKFLYNLDESISNMIQKWSYEKNEKELEYKTKGQKEFIDDRGKISNYELTEPINLIGLITSKENTMRANHFHPIQEQKVLLVEGQFISVYQNLLKKNSPKITHIINKNDSVVTKPNVAHTMVFSKDSTFLNLVRGEREHKNYGISHTMPYQLISKKEKLNLLSGYKFNCRCCNATNLKRVISLGFHAPANNLINKETAYVEKYPLELNFCENCSNCQLSYVVKPEKLFSKYLYLSSTSGLFRKHFVNAANYYKKYFKLSSKKSTIVDVGSNDGIALSPFKDLGFKNVIGIEPAKNIAVIARKKGIKTINSYMDKSVIKKINKKADLVLASNVFAHADKLDEMTSSIFKILKKNGTLIIEVQYLLNTLKDLSFDNIYHEHVNYWSATTLNKYFSKFGAKIYKIEEVNTHGGSIRVYVTQNKSKKNDNSVSKILRKEKLFGITKFETFKKFSKKIEEAKDNFINNLSKISKDNNVVGYGAPAKASTMLNYFGVKGSIKYIIDDNLLKNKKIIPGCNIKIYNKNSMPFKPDAILVLAWNFYKDIKNKNKKLSKKFFNCRDLQELPEI